MSRDIALAMLMDAARKIDATDSVLWVVDEQTAIQTLLDSYAYGEKPFLLTQRYDQVRAWRLAGGQGVANDYDFSAINNSQQIFFRIVKEKALLHYVINQALIHLPVDGVLWLAGGIDEGAKSLIEKLRDLTHVTVEVERGDKKTLCANITKLADIKESLLDDRDYADWFELQYDDPLADADAADTDDEMQTFVSKSGIYGWDKVDAGTELLWKAVIDADAKKSLEVKTILDLGCGYGWLIVQAGLQWPDAKLIATDNNVTALMAVQQNTYRFGLQTDIIAADAGDEVTDQVDLLLCNPPFHQGFDVEGDLTLRFLKAAARLLKKPGSAFFVVNSFIPLEKKAVGIFSKIDTVEDSKKFKVVRLSHA